MDRWVSARRSWAWVVVAAVLLAAPQAGAQAPDENASTPAAEKPKAKTDKSKTDKKEADEKKKSAREEARQKKAEAAKKKSDAKAPPAGTAPFEPKTVDVGKLPGPIVSLHNCAPVAGKVEMAQERYGKSVLFFVSCPAKERGGYQLQAVYVARDARGAGARRVTFEVPGADGSAATLDAIPSAIPARETYTEKVEERDVVRSRNDPPWITGAWRPEDREGVCAVVGHWRVQDAKAELWLWEEASECPKDGAPKYQTKLDKKPPALVAR
jgi:hypothetical protein